MDFKDLRCVVTIAETRNITRAAEKLFMTQPALSRSLRNLEAELGVRLLDRDARPIALTRAGELFYERARRILRMEESLLQDMNRLKSGFNLHLNIEYGMAGQVPALTTILNRFKKSFPDSTVDVQRQFNARALQDLLDERCDIAILNLPDYPENRGLSMRVIRREGMCAFVPETHPYYNRDVLSAEDFQGTRICIFERYAAPKLYDSIMSFFTEAAIEFEEIEYTPDTPTFTLMVLLNDLIGVMPRSTMSMAPTKIREIPIVGTSGLDVVAAWREDNRNEAVQAFLSVLEPGE